MTTIRRLSTVDANFDGQLTALLAWESVNDHQLQQTVAQMLAHVQAEGDSAVVETLAVLTKLARKVWPN